MGYTVILPCRAEKKLSNLIQPQEDLNQSQSCLFLAVFSIKLILSDTSVLNLFSSLGSPASSRFLNTYHLGKRYSKIHICIAVINTIFLRQLVDKMET